jgi:folate-binding protein YgfZ
MGLMRFAGSDALSFLQGQLSNDTGRLEKGSPLLAAYSTPQGRVAAVMHVLPYSGGAIAILPREILLPTLERLRKFVLRAKVAAEDVSEHYVLIGLHDPSGLRDAGLGTPDAGSGYLEQGGIGIGRVSSRSSRYWVIGSTADLAKHQLAGEHSSRERGAERIERDWRLADIREGLPQIYAATREMFVAQMLNLDLIDGISFTKGCFTGQEIIARTQHLGRIKRRMFRLRLPAGSWAIGQAVHLIDGRAGRLTEVVPEGEEFEALAVLNLEASAPETDAPGDTVAAHELPLPYSPAQSA